MGKIPMVQFIRISMIQPSCKKYNSLMTNSTAFVGHNAKATMEFPWFFVQGQTQQKLGGAWDLFLLHLKNTSNSWPPPKHINFKILEKRR